MLQNNTKVLWAVSGLVVVLFAAFLLTRTPGQPRDAASAQPPSVPSTATPSATIGGVETIKRPPLSPEIQSAPETKASSGPVETGPHGQSDVTKGTPKSAPEAARTAEDRPVGVAVPK